MKKWLVYGCCGCSLLIITIGLLAGSFAVVTPQQLGLKFNAVTIEFDDSTVYGAGRHYVGVGSYFFIFPRKLNYVEFSGGSQLDVWSQDGQLVYVEVSFYYKLLESRLHDTFYLYRTDFDRVIRAMAAETIRDVATTWNTIDFFTNRSDIDDAMTRALGNRLYRDANANVTLFNLLAIDVPDLFEAAVINKVITAQNVITLQRLRESQIIRTAIAVIDASATANITVINANATATGLLISKTAEAAATRTVLEARATKLSQLANDLNFTSSQDLLQYLYTDIIRSTAPSSLTVAYDVNSAILRV